MELVLYPSDILKRTSKAVNVEDPGFDPIEMKKLMVDTMLQNNGIGLSANQVNVDYQLFVMGSDSQSAEICINPTILQHTDDSVLEDEGCLSFPGIFVQVKRPKEILVEYYDENLVQRRQHLKDYPVKVFLHEYDHLQGICYKDRVSPLKWKMAVKKRNKRR
tara:strand:+ start:26 stop:511 length:486 start_codon:yes stop_codon:yes gene_type:complete